MLQVYCLQWVTLGIDGTPSVAPWASGTTGAHLMSVCAAFLHVSVCTWVRVGVCACASRVLRVCVPVFGGVCLCVPVHVLRVCVCVVVETLIVGYEPHVHE
jgi:hypothetical protein